MFFQHLDGFHTSTIVAIAGVAANTTGIAASAAIRFAWFLPRKDYVRYANLLAFDLPTVLVDFSFFRFQLTTGYVATWTAKAATLAA